MQDTAPHPAVPPRPGEHVAPGPYRLVSREALPAYRGTTRTREVQVAGVRIGGAEPVIIAGPCAVESRVQTLAIARAVREAGGQLLRGGTFKPRTSPHDFQGCGLTGLEILAEARAETGLGVVTEVMDVRLVEQVARFADCLQVGARSMQNFPLLREVGRTGKPVLLKRHWGASLTEWLCAAEYIAVEGNLDIILCERGVRTHTHGEYSRCTLDLAVIPALRERTFLPVVVDPSHSTGVAAYVPSLARAGVAAGAHGLIIEVIAQDADPAGALCDGAQSIRPSDLATLVADLRAWTSRHLPASASL
jgi:3-deoxy-7-phosphoheptulonate synthase